MSSVEPNEERKSCEDPNDENHVYQQVEINRELVLSTGHISEKFSEDLTLGRVPWCLIYSLVDYGFLIYTYPDPLGRVGREIPEELQHLFALAWHHDCKWLRLDADGPLIKGLPRYHW